MGSRQLRNVERSTLENASRRADDGPPTPILCVCQSRAGVLVSPASPHRAHPAPPTRLDPVTPRARSPGWRTKWRARGPEQVRSPARMRWPSPTPSHCDWADSPCRTRAPHPQAAPSLRIGRGDSVLRQYSAGCGFPAPTVPSLIQPQEGMPIPRI